MKTKPAPQASPLSRVPLAAGGIYLLVVLALWIGKANAPGAIGAVCGGGCVPATLLGLPLEALGGALMMAVLAIMLTAATGTAMGTLGATLAMIHAGSSLAFAATQWFGWVPVCLPCQVAMVLSLIVAAFLAGELKGPLKLPLLQPLAVGTLAVAAAWPFLRGINAAPDAQVPLPVSELRAIAPASDTSAPQLFDTLTLGNPAAPFELVVLSDFNCPVCERFETRTLPELMEKAVYTGKLRVRFVYKNAFDGSARGTTFELIAATCLVKAGADLTAVQKLFRGKKLQSTPQGIALWPDPELRARATEILANAGTDGEWAALHREHQRIGGLLRSSYFAGTQATPLFLLSRAPLNPNDLPPASEVYAFKGYQVAAPFLEFLGGTRQ